MGVELSQDQTLPCVRFFRHPLALHFHGLLQQVAYTAVATLCMAHEHAHGLHLFRRVVRAARETNALHHTQVRDVITHIGAMGGLQAGGGDQLFQFVQFVGHAIMEFRYTEPGEVLRYSIAMAAGDDDDP